MGLKDLQVNDSCGSWHLYTVHMPFSFRSLDHFEGHFVLCYKEKSEPLDRAMSNFEVIGLYDFRCSLRASLSLTPL